jgi:thioredoxin 1
MAELRRGVLGRGASVGPITLTVNNFERTVAGAGRIIVDFWADWCHPCRRFAPVFEQASQRHRDVVFAKVDTETERALAEAMQIASIPTLMAFSGGTLVYAQAGALSAAELDEVVDAVRRTR